VPSDYRNISSLAKNKKRGNKKCLKIKTDFIQGLTLGKPCKAWNICGFYAERICACASDFYPQIAGFFAVFPRILTV